MFSGDQVLNRNYTLSEIPLFVQAGSIIPMKTDDFGTKSAFSLRGMCNKMIFVYRTIGICSSYPKGAQANGICRRCFVVSLVFVLYSSMLSVI